LSAEFGPALALRRDIDDLAVGHDAGSAAARAASADTAMATMAAMDAGMTDARRRSDAGAAGRRGRGVDDARDGGPGAVHGRRGEGLREDVLWGSGRRGSGVRVDDGDDARGAVRVGA
jgi:hypothetical protein